MINSEPLDVIEDIAEVVEAAEPEFKLDDLLDTSYCVDDMLQPWISSSVCDTLEAEIVDSMVSVF